MIDFHSHILPDMDDGAKDIKTSLDMLRESSIQGTNTIVSTSHCYPKNEESIKNFLLYREVSYQQLSDKIKKSDIALPKIIKGCEVNMLTDLSDLKNIYSLCIENTNYILIEMPYSLWKDWMLECVYKLTLLGLKPIMAHIDRYTIQDIQNLSSLVEFGVVFQINGELFLDKKMKKIADKIMYGSCAHILGSDMHSMNVRKPNIAQAKDIITTRYGAQCFEQMKENAYAILNNQDIKYRTLNIHKPKKKLFDFSFK